MLNRFGTGVTRRRPSLSIAQRFSVILAGVSTFAYYDPSDTTAMRLGRDGSGGEPVADDVIGLLLDKSQMGESTAGAFIAAQSELTTNGGFDADSDWTKGTGWTISGGAASSDGSQVGDSDLSQASILASSTGWHVVTLTVANRSAGSISILTGTTESSQLSADGDYEFILQAAGNTNFIIRADVDFVGDVTVVSVKEVPGYHAVASSDAARPIYRSGGYLAFDESDDAFSYDFGAAIAGTKVVGYGDGVVVGEFADADGSITDNIYHPDSEWYGAFICGETIGPFGSYTFATHLRDAGAGVAFGAVTNFTSAFRQMNWTSLDIDYLDVSSGTLFNNAWNSCSGLTSFPALDVSSGTTFVSAWEGCSGLTSFPALDLSSGTNFTQTWLNCSGLTSFPALDVSAGTTFNSTWWGCSGLTSFPALDVSAGTSFNSAWRLCAGLTSFPANMFDSVTATNFTSAFTNCALDVTSVNAILVSIEAAGTSGGTLGIGGGTNAAPTGAGAAAVTALQGRGWTVTTN